MNLDDIYVELPAGAIERGTAKEILAVYSETWRASGEFIQQAASGFLDEIIKRLNQKSRFTSEQQFSDVVKLVFGFIIKGDVNCEYARLMFYTTVATYIDSRR